MQCSILKEVKDKNHMIILIDTEKNFNKTQHPFVIKSSDEIRNRRNVPHSDKGYILYIYRKHHTNEEK
jgi:hypothetical protein